MGFIFLCANTDNCFCLLGAGEILFEEDFESGLDENVWIPAGTWKIIDGTLDIEGGGEGFTVRNDFTDFEGTYIKMAGPFRAGIPFY